MEWAYLPDIYCLDLSFVSLSLSLPVSAAQSLVRHSFSSSEEGLFWSKIRLNRTRLLNRFSHTCDLYNSQAIIFGGDLTSKHKFTKVFKHDLLCLDMQYVTQLNVFPRRLFLIYL